MPEEFFCRLSDETLTDASLIELIKMVKTLVRNRRKNCCQNIHDTCLKCLNKLLTQSKSSTIIFILGDLLGCGPYAGEREQKRKRKKARARAYVDPKERCVQS